MARHSPTRDDREEVASSGFTRLLFMAMGVAVLLGLISGLAWTGYHLVRRFLLD